MQKLNSIALALLMLGVIQNGSAQQASELPPNPKAGECYAKIYMAPKYETVTEQVLVRETSSRMEVIPARYITADEVVVVREASKNIQVVPATFKYVDEQVVSRPASKRTEIVPAIYEMVTEQVKVKEAYTTWKRGSSYLGQAKATKRDVSTSNSDDDILCLVEVPAEYRTVNKRIEKAPASVRETDIPAEYTVVRKQIVDQPAHTVEVEIPAVTRVVKVSKMVEPAKETRIDIPAEYGQVTKTRQVAAASIEWRSILCETNATPEKIREIQRALNGQGFDVGAVNGRLSSQAMRAVNAFQRSRNLPEDTYLNLETVRALGLQP